MKTINEVRMRARIAKEGTLRTFEAGSMVKIIVCTEYSMKNRQGEFEKHPEYHTVIVKGNKASAAANLRKGQMVDFNGRLKTRVHEFNGEKKYSTEVLTWELKPVEEQQPQTNHAAADEFWNR